MQKPSAMKRFILQRDEDESGVSGTGVVAEGTQYATGWCSLSWLTEYQSIGIYPDIDELVLIHGHDGRTKIVWVDE